MAGELANKALRFGAAAVLARGLSPDDFGLFNVGIAAAGILVVLTTLGLPEIGGRAVAIDPDRASSLGGTVATVRVLASAGLGALALAIVEVAWPGHLAFGGAVVAMAIVMSATADWLGRGLERMRIVGLGAAAGGFVAIMGSAAVAALSGSAVAGLAAFVAAEFMATCVYWTALRGRGRPRIGLAGAGGLLRRSWPVALSSVAIYSYYANLDTIIMAATRSTSEAGVYSAAYRIYLAANIVGIFAAYATFPKMSRIDGLDRIGVLVEHLRPTLELLVVYGVVVVGIALAIGHDGLQVLFGNRFGAAGDTFILLCISTAWYCFGYPIGYNLVAAGRNRRFLAGSVVGAVVNLGLDVVLIPTVGMVGAGVATSTSIVLAAFTWLGADGIVSPAARRSLTVVTISSGAAVGALLWPAAEPAVGVAMIVVGSVLALRLVSSTRRPA